MNTNREITDAQARHIAARSLNTYRHQYPVNDRLGHDFHARIWRGIKLGIKSAAFTLYVENTYGRGLPGRAASQGPAETTVPAVGAQGEPGQGSLVVER